MPVYIRAIMVKRALYHNAAAVILAHNHLVEPSAADEALTHALKETLATMEVVVLDHFVIGAGYAWSFAEQWLL